MSKLTIRNGLIVTGYRIISGTGDYVDVARDYSDDDFLNHDAALDAANRGLARLLAEPSNLPLKPRIIEMGIRTSVPDNC